MLHERCSDLCVMCVSRCVSSGLVFVGLGCDLLRSRVSRYHTERAPCIKHISVGYSALTSGKHAVLRH